MGKHELHGSPVDARTVEESALAKHRENYADQVNPYTGQTITTFNVDTRVHVMLDDGNDYLDSDGQQIFGVIAAGVLDPDTHELEGYYIAPVEMAGLPTEFLHMLGALLPAQDSGVCTADGTPIVLVPKPE